MTNRLLIILILSFCSVTAFAGHSEWQNPVITKAGKIDPLPQADNQPDPKDTYKVAFMLSKEGSDPGKVNPALDHVARALNLYSDAGVPLNNLEFIAVIGGEATFLALDNKHYKEKFGVDNPNLPVIRELKKNGVKITLCGQMIRHKNLKYSWIDNDVGISLSAMTTVIKLQKKGYSVIPL